jgi:ribosomal protein L40E
MNPVITREERIMKYCSKCGGVNEDDALYCQRCGTPLLLAPAAPPAAEPYAAQVPAAEPPESNTAMLWLVLNIISTVLCCPGFLFSVIGIVFAALGSESFRKGDMTDMRKKSTVAMILFIVGVLLGLVGWIIILVTIIRTQGLGWPY